MDKLPRLRRKPKPPAIETSVERTNSNLNESALPAADAASEATASKSSPQRPSMKKTPLRNLKLRVNAKRARTQSPAARPQTSPPVAVFNQDGVAPRTATDERLATNGHGHGHGHGRSRSLMPAFLNNSAHDIESKFQELTWAERHRLAQGARPHTPLNNNNTSSSSSSSNNKWGSFKQTGGPSRGTMDRYVDIKPWNHNRVRLKVADDAFDYVNASTIALDPSRDVSLPPLRYIAMQGPTPPSFTYVWRMIAEQTASPAIIVQLTSMVESGAIKCHQYFPDSAEDPVWALNQDDIWKDGWKATVRYDSRQDMLDGAIQRRRLVLHVDGEADPRIVWHLLYTRWPDFGVPTLDDTQSFLALMRISHDMNSVSSHPQPRIIHCSAGVGRTGTFITLEHLMRELRLDDRGRPRPDTAHHAAAHNDQDQDLIYHTVDLLRRQRRSMVQSETQYRFLYDILRKLWLDKYGLVLEGHDADGSGTAEPAPKRLEVAEGLPLSSDGEEGASLRAGAAV